MNEEPQITEARSIMLIDDDPDDQLFFRDAIALMHADLVCHLASSCQEAFRQLEKLPPPAFIFMDLNMPVMNGFDCLMYLKNHESYRKIPIIIFTTSKNLQDISRTRQLGASYFMTKPDDFNVLCKKLSKIILDDTIDGLYVI
jgi:CheY-like chemotaxis protein